jgi:hypothetical protein
VQIYASTNAAADTRRSLRQLSDSIAILQREHDQLIPLVAEGPQHLRPTRLRQLRWIAKQLVAARAEEARISDRLDRVH